MKYIYFLSCDNMIADPRVKTDPATPDSRGPKVKIKIKNILKMLEISFHKYLIKMNAEIAERYIISDDGTLDIIYFDNISLKTNTLAIKIKIIKLE